MAEPMSPSTAGTAGPDLEPTSRIALTVNATRHELEVPNRALLVDVLRDQLGLTGTHVGCDTTQCGCCIVHLDGAAVKSCTVLAVQADGSSVTTIEGLAPEGGLHPVQEAFSACHGLQCGFCTPGMVMATVDLLARHPQPDDEQIRRGLAGNLCRCTGYVNIEAAVRDAAARLADPTAS
jgi:carbon-monoxide dehydrogenase small subunit